MKDTWMVQCLAPVRLHAMPQQGPGVQQALPHSHLQQGKTDLWNSLAHWIAAHVAHANQAPIRE